MLIFLVAISGCVTQSQKESTNYTSTACPICEVCKITIKYNQSLCPKEDASVRVAYANALIKINEMQKQLNEMQKQLDMTSKCTLTAANVRKYAIDGYNMANQSINLTREILKKNLTNHIEMTRNNFNKDVKSLETALYYMQIAQRDFNYVAKMNLDDLR
jgi:division protein CdvB (Snf7/Vps24/ESCRT-III family)